METKDILLELRSRHELSQELSLKNIQCGRDKLFRVGKMVKDCAE